MICVRRKCNKYDKHDTLVMLALNLDYELCEKCIDFMKKINDMFTNNKHIYIKVIIQLLYIYTTIILF